jgi:hypothetical protein
MNNEAIQARNYVRNFYDSEPNPWNKTDRNAFERVIGYIEMNCEETVEAVEKEKPIVKKEESEEVKMTLCKNGGCPLDKELCCQSCDQLEDCKGKGFNCTDSPDNCGDAEYEAGSTDLQIFKESQLTLLNQIANVTLTKKIAEEEEKKLKEKLQEAMEKYNVKKFESEVLNLTYIAASTATSVDSKKLKADHPEIYEECSKTSDRKAYVKIALK